MATAAYRSNVDATPKRHLPSGQVDGLPFIPSALDDYPLTGTQMRVYVHIARRTGTGADGLFFESIPNCASHCRLNEKTTRAVVHDLVAFGMIQPMCAKPGRTVAYRLTSPSTW